MPVWVCPGQGLVPPVDGVDVAVNAVVVGAGAGAGRAAVLQTLSVRLGQRLQPGEKHLGIAIIKILRHIKFDRLTHDIQTDQR